MSNNSNLTLQTNYFGVLTGKNDVLSVETLYLSMLNKKLSPLFGTQAASTANILSENFLMNLEQSKNLQQYNASEKSSIDLDKTGKTNEYNDYAKTQYMSKFKTRASQTQYMSKFKTSAPQGKSLVERSPEQLRKALQWHEARYEAAQRKNFLTSGSHESHPDYIKAKNNMQAITNNIARYTNLTGKSIYPPGNKLSQYPKLNDDHPYIKLLRERADQVYKSSPEGREIANQILGLQNGTMALPGQEGVVSKDFAEVVRMSNSGIMKRAGYDYNSALVQEIRNNPDFNNIGPNRTSEMKVDFWYQGSARGVEPHFPIPLSVKRQGGPAYVKHLNATYGDKWKEANPEQPPHIKSYIDLARKVAMTESQNLKKELVYSSKSVFDKTPEMIG